MQSEIKDVKLNVNQAIPCGLILNELVTNVYKHAFPNGVENREINVDIRQRDHQIILSVSDNGVGLPENVRIEENNSIGLTIVNILCKQLNADIKIKTDKGTKFVIRFDKIHHKRGPASNM